MTRFLVVIAAALVALGSTVPASASQTVHLQVSLGVPDAAVIADCDVAVADNADGVAVLQAAVNSGCIDSYEVVQFSSGPYVSCINGICHIADGLVASWNVYFDNVSATVGVGDYQPSQGELEFVFNNFVTTCNVGCLI